MILRRLVASLRGQNWTSVAIELGIVVLGVFIGLEAANWNQARQERQETHQLLSQLEAELTTFRGFLEELDEYYATTRRYAAVADAAWRGDPSISDREFVIAAYQASQVRKPVRLLALQSLQKPRSLILLVAHLKGYAVPKWKEEF